MSAVLKKRAVAELCQMTQGPPAKKFKASTSLDDDKTVGLDLNKCKTQKEVLQALSSLTFPVPVESVTTLVGHLIGHYQLESSSVVKLKILVVVQDLVAYPTCDSESLSRVLMDLLRAERSSGVMAQLVATQKTIGLLNFSNKKLVTQIINSSLEIIQDTDHFDRIKCFELIGHLGSEDVIIADHIHGQSNSRVSLKDILISFTDDSDWRVRLHALEAILQWHSRKLPIDGSLYQHLMVLLVDNQERVRLAVIKLMWVIAQMNPEMLVDGTKRMVDHCFEVLCEAIEDISDDVRAQAGKLLGSMHEVDQPVLYQTLQKELMSNHRRKVSAHERQREMFASGEWSTGKVSSDAPRERIDPNSVVLCPGGACGAFINGLEDENSRVRNATLDSICELSCQHPSFAQKCLDFAVDMLTDEIDSVRLNGINSLHKMSSLVAIRDDQLELILWALKDCNINMREATHRLLSSCSLSTTNGVKTTITLLLKNLSLYPEDKFSIWRTMKSVGARNSPLVFAALPTLLGLHPFFDIKENELGDPSYVALMILASNASPNCPTMTSILPAFIFHHFTHLKNVYPDLIPDTWFPNSGLSRESKKISSPLLDQKKVLSVILSQLDKMNFMRDIPSAYKHLRIACRDLKKVEELAPLMSACAKFLTFHLRCQIKINEILSQNQFSSNSRGSSSLGREMQKLARTLAYMKTVFVGITSELSVEIHQLSLVVSAIQLLNNFPSSNQSDKESMCFAFSNKVIKLTDLLELSDLPTSRMVSHLNSELNAPTSANVADYRDVLLASLRIHACTLPLMPRLDNHLLMMKATIVEPTSSSDVVYSFVAKYILAVRMVVELENVECIERIRIHVKYPNQEEYLMKPYTSNFNTTNNMQHRLSTLVSFSGGPWSEPCKVHLQVVYMNPNAEDEVLLGRSSAGAGYFELSDVVATTIHPVAQ